MLHSDITHFYLKSLLQALEAVVGKNRCMMTPEFIPKKWLEVVSWWKDEGLEAVLVLAHSIRLVKRWVISIDEWEWGG